MPGVGWSALGRGRHAGEPVAAGGGRGGGGRRGGGRNRGCRHGAAGGGAAGRGGRGGAGGEGDRSGATAGAAHRRRWLVLDAVRGGGGQRGRAVRHDVAAHQAGGPAAAAVRRFAAGVPAAVDGHADLPADRVHLGAGRAGRLRAVQLRGDRGVRVRDPAGRHRRAVADEQRVRLAGGTGR